MSTKPQHIITIDSNLYSAINDIQDAVTKLRKKIDDSLLAHPHRLLLTLKNGKQEYHADTYLSDNKLKFRTTQTFSHARKYDSQEHAYENALLLIRDFEDIISINLVASVCVMSITEDTSRTRPFIAYQKGAEQ